MAPSDKALSKKLLREATTEAVDIFALGLIYYQIFHPQHVVLKHQNMKTEPRIMSAIQKLTQSTLNDEIEEGLGGTNNPLLVKLIQEMTSVDPKNRPTMAQVTERLKEAEQAQIAQAEGFA